MKVGAPLGKVKQKTILKERALAQEKKEHLEVMLDTESGFQGDIL